MIMVVMSNFLHVLTIVSGTVLRALHNEYLF